MSGFRTIQLVTFGFGFVFIGPIDSPAACPTGAGNHVIGEWGQLIQPIMTPRPDIVDNPATPNVDERAFRPFPMHAHLLRNGKVLIIPTEDVETNIKVRLLDPATGSLSDEFPVPTLNVNSSRDHLIPCAGHVALPDGRVLFVGGVGSALLRSRATILDPDPTKLDLSAWPAVTCNGCWVEQDDMPSSSPTVIDSARFYPTPTVLGDGRVLVMAGSSNANGCPLAGHERGDTPIIFDASKPTGQQWSVLEGGKCCPGPGKGELTDPIGSCADLSNGCGNQNCTPQTACCEANAPSSCAASIPNQFHINYYPHNFLLTNGTIAVTGSTAGPWEDLDPKTRRFNTASTGSWFEIGDDPLPAKFTASIMYRPNLILKAGGRKIVPNNSNTGADTNEAYKIDMSASSPTWTSIPMNHKRRGICLVTLADGKVMAVNGFDTTTSGLTTDQRDNRSPEIIDLTATNPEWCDMAPMAPRSERLGINGQYNADYRGNHSEALLLPDGRVLVMGGETDSNSTTSNNNAQIFSPPYLFATDGSLAIRPLINSVGPVADTLRYGLISRIVTDVAGSENVVINMIRPGASTHSFDAEQRFIPLPYRVIPTNTSISYLEIDPLPDGNLAPPGFYMLFVLKDGVPSIARMVNLERCELPSKLTPDTESKVRFISFTVSPSVDGPGTGDIALRVVPERMPFQDDFPAFVGQARYVGPPNVYAESASGGAKFIAARLQCDPYYREDWTQFKSCSNTPKLCTTNDDCTVGEGTCTVTVDPMIHVTGSVIVPSAVYHVTALGSACIENEPECEEISCTIELRTRKWGDVETPWNPPSTTTQPDLVDVGAMVDKFRLPISSLPKVHTMIIGSDQNGGEINDVTIQNEFSFTNIAYCVDAFRGSAYPGTIAECP